LRLNAQLLGAEAFGTALSLLHFSRGRARLRRAHLEGRICMMLARSALLTFSEKCAPEGFKNRAHGFGGLASHREAQAAEPRRDILGDLAAIAAAIGMGPGAIDAGAHPRQP